MKTLRENETGTGLAGTEERRAALEHATAGIAAAMLGTAAWTRSAAQAAGETGPMRTPDA